MSEPGGMLISEKIQDRQARFRCFMGTGWMRLNELKEFQKYPAVKPLWLLLREPFSSGFCCLQPFLSCKVMQNTLACHATISGKHGLAATLMLIGFAVSQRCCSGTCCKHTAQWLWSVNFKAS